MPRRRSRKYTVQISNYGRLRSNYQWRKFWNGSYSGRFGVCRFLICRNNLYYDVIDLARKTFGNEFRGHRMVQQTKKIRAMSVKFRGERTDLKSVSRMIGVPHSRLLSYVCRGLKIKGERLTYYYPSPERDPESYYLIGEKWMYPKFGLCEGHK